MYILLYILVGGIAGWLASIIMHQNSRMGIIANIIVGLIGAAIGGLIAQLTGLGGLSIFTFWGFGFAVLGAIILIAIINAIRGHR